MQRILFLGYRLVCKKVSAHLLCHSESIGKVSDIYRFNLTTTVNYKQLKRVYTPLNNPPLHSVPNLTRQQNLPLRSLKYY